MGKKIWVIAHRGASRVAPENTMAAFRRAIDLGAGYIETDIQLSSDGQFVCMHDTSLERTTSGAGDVNQHTLAELRALDAGVKFDAGFAGERIPALEELLVLAREKSIGLYLEAKCMLDPAACAKLWEAVHGAGLEERVVVSAFRPAVLRNLRAAAPGQATSLLFEQPIRDVVRIAQGLGVRQLGAFSFVATSILTAQAHAEGMSVYAWTIDEPEEIRSAIEAGVDGIISDYPERVVEAVRG